MQTHIPIHTTSETSLLSKHSSLTGVLQLSNYVHLNVAEFLILCCFPTGLKKRTRKAFGIRKKEKDTDSTYVL